MPEPTTLAHHLTRAKRMVRNRLARLAERPLPDLPRTRLQPIHVEGSELVLNRAQLLKRMPRNGIVAELGVDQGSFSRRILEMTGAQRLILVDIWGTDRYGDAKFEDVRAKFATEIAAGRVAIHRKTSTDAAQDFPDGHFDWIYIDTDHSYATTKAELELWAPKVKATGFMAGHDYVQGNWRKRVKYGVVEAVAEFCVQSRWRLSHVTADHTENNSFAITRIR
jgi:hypothetical protein